MDTLTKDLKVLDLSERRAASSLMDLLGVNIDSPQYRDMCETYFGNDIQSISTGGSNVTNDQSQTIIIRPQVSDGVVNLKSMTILCRYLGASIRDVPVNALALFRPVSIKISNFTKAYSYGEVFVQQMLESMNAATVYPYKKGCWIGEVRDHDLVLSIVGNGLAAGVGYRNGDLFAAQTASSATAADVNIAADYVQAYHSMMQNYLVSKGIDGDRNIAVPVWMLFYPLINALDWSLFCKYPGQIEFQLQTVPAAECIVQTMAKGNATYTVPGAVPASYNLENFYIFFQYSRLVNSPALLSSIMSSELEYRPEYTIQNAVPFNQTTTLVFSASRNQRLQQLSFGCHQNSATRAAGQLIVSAATLNAANTYSGECILFPSYRIQQITINASGKVVTLNPQAIAAMQLIQPTQTAGVNYPHLEGPYGDSNAWRSVRCPYNLDLTRFGFEDAIGSSNGLVENITVTIQWSLAEDLSVFAGIPSIGNDTRHPIASPTNTTVYGFIIVSSKMIMKNGEYFEAQ